MTNQIHYNLKGVILIGKFKCTCCGLCCRNISGIPLYQDLERGDGICKYLNEKTNLCIIYKTRPLKCNVDEMYKVFFSEKMSIEEYYELNYRACKALQNGV